jgi:hypothetical protein
MAGGEGMSWQRQLNGDTVSWLLASATSGVRYLALRDLLDLPSDDIQLLAKKELAHSEGPISLVLNEMNPAGYWVEAAPGYNPKYRSTVWSIILLGQLGASADLENGLHRHVNICLKTRLHNTDNSPQVERPLER